MAARKPGRASDVVTWWDGAPFDPSHWPDVQIMQTVWRRRAGDKLGPLLRWARATTAHLPLEDRLGAVGRLFDDNLIGRHALSHLTWDDHFHIPREHDPWWRRETRRPRLDPAPSLRATAAAALEHGDHAALNRWMKDHPDRDGRVRVLAGWHDLDAFAAACSANPVWRLAAERFSAAGLRTEDAAVPAQSSS